MILPVFLPAGIAGGNELTLKPSLSIREEYNDNIYIDDQNRVDDTISILSPEVKLKNKTQRLDSEFQCRADGLLFAKNDELNAFDQFYDGRMEYRISERMSTGSRFGYSVDSRPDRDIAVTGQVLDATRRERFYLDLSSWYLLSQNWSTGLSTAYDDEDFDQSEPDDEYDDLQSSSASVTFQYRMNRYIPGTTGRLNAGIERYDYDTSDIFNSSSTIGIHHQVHETIEIQADVGYYSTRSEYPISSLEYDSTGALQLIDRKESVDGNGMIGILELSNNTEKTRSSVRISQNVAPTSGQNQATLRTSAAYHFTWDFNEDLRILLDASYIINRTDQEEESNSSHQEETFQIYPAIHYDITKQIGAYFGYSYLNVVNKTDNTTNRKNLFIIQFSYNKSFDL